MLELVHECRFACVFACVSLGDNNILLHDNSLFLSSSRSYNCIYITLRTLTMFGIVNHPFSLLIYLSVLGTLSLLIQIQRPSNVKTVYVVIKICHYCLLCGR